jgi:copper chaperone
VPTTTETISVPEVHCDHCVSSIEGALGPMPGVEEARVDLEARNVTVTFDPHSTSRGDLVAAIEDQGYDVA